MNSLVNYHKKQLKLFFYAYVLNVSLFQKIGHSGKITLSVFFFRVMGFVQKVVARLDEKEKLDKLLEELGKAHFYYGAPKKYIDVS